MRFFVFLLFVVLLYCAFLSPPAASPVVPSPVASPIYTYRPKHKFPMVNVPKDIWSRNVVRVATTQQINKMRGYYESYESEDNVLDLDKLFERIRRQNEVIISNWTIFHFNSLYVKNYLAMLSDVIFRELEMYYRVQVAPLKAPVAPLKAPVASLKAPVQSLKKYAQCLTKSYAEKINLIPAKIWRERRDEIINTGNELMSHGVNQGEIRDAMKESLYEILLDFGIPIV